MNPLQRRKAMQSNRGRTRPERRVAAALWGRGYRYLTADGYRSRYGRRLPGSPDLILIRQRCVLFVDGCFWHGCRHCHDPDRELSAWWREKIEENIRRDRRIRARLRRAGWMVLSVREHALAPVERFERTIQRLVSRVPSRMQSSRYHGWDAGLRSQAQGV